MSSSSSDLRPALFTGIALMGGRVGLAPCTHTDPELIREWKEGIVTESVHSRSNPLVCITDISDRDSSEWYTLKVRLDSRAITDFWVEFVMENRKKKDGSYRWHYMSNIKGRMCTTESRLTWVNENLILERTTQAQLIINNAELLERIKRM